MITVWAAAETPAAYCSRVGRDDTARPIPEELVPAVNAAFGTRMPARVTMDTTVFRCANGRVLACTTGANLPCGKANVGRTPGPGAARWCRDNPNATSIPAFAVGHDTLYEWGCRNGTAHIVRQVLHADPQGFVAEIWKTLP